MKTHIITTAIFLLLFLFSCAALKHTPHYAYHVGDVLIYNHKDSVTVRGLEVAPDKEAMYLVSRNGWKMHVEECFLTPTK